MPKPFYGRMFFSADDGAGSGGGAATGTETVETKTETTETKPDDRQELKDALAKERKAAKDAQRELDALKTDQQRRADDEAKQQGKFEELAEKRLTEITTLSTDRDGLQQQNDDLTARLKAFEDQAEADYTASVKALPEELRDLAPGGDLLTRREWLAKAQKTAEKLAKSRPRDGNGPNPHATGPTADAADDAARLRQRQRTRL